MTTTHREYTLHFNKDGVQCHPVSNAIVLADNDAEAIRIAEVYIRDCLNPSFTLNYFTHREVPFYN